jgi:glucosamine 6-phosphate synthetase-like amidotransferase/phosphosugar isomerase protein
VLHSKLLSNIQEIRARGAVPLQVLAAEIARERGYDVDKPRNLAKSVTVE